MNTETLINQLKSNPDHRSQAMAIILEAGFQEALEKAKDECLVAEIAPYDFLEALFACISTDLIVSIPLVPGEAADLIHDVGDLFKKVMARNIIDLLKLREAS